MKKQFASLLLSLSLSTTAMATKPYPPYTNTDMNTIGSGFEGVEQVVLSTADGDDVFSRCSAVKVNIPAPGAVYLTAAHCFDHNPPLVSVNGLLTSTFFIHPAYIAAKQFDMAAILVREEPNEGGYDIFSGDPQSLLTSLTMHVGYGRQEGVDMPPRQGFVAQINKVTDTTFVQNINQPSGLMAETALGDSGGPLFMRDWEGTFKVAGLTKGGNFDLVDGSSSWAILSSEFVHLVQTVFSQESLPLWDPLQLRVQAEEIWLLEQGYQIKDWRSVMNGLSLLPEALWFHVIPSVQKDMELGGLESLTEKTIAVLKQAADAGHPFAQFLLACAFFEKWGEENNPMALEYLERAAVSGVPMAQFAWAETYLSGEIEVFNPQLARYWIEAAQAQWNPDALSTEIQDNFGQLLFCMPED